MSSPAARLLCREDAAAAAALHALCFPAAEQWSAWAFRDSLALTTTLGLAIEEEERLSAMILIQRVPPDAEILTLAVTPARRRNGYAAMLLARTCELLGPYGLERLMLDVASDNDGAIKFYHSCGFATDGRRKNYYNRPQGKHADAILMSRAVAGHVQKSKA